MGFERKFKKDLNAFHHFPEPGYCLATDPSIDPYLAFLRNECATSLWDDCDSVLDPLSLDENGGDSSRYQLCGNDGTTWVGYRFKSANFYARVLWFSFCDMLYNSQPGCSNALGKIAHLSQDIAGVPQHAALTLMDGHAEFEDYILKEFLPNNWDFVVGKALNEYIKPRSAICGFISLVEHW
jgi:hypothetical protein